MSLFASLIVAGMGISTLIMGSWFGPLLSVLILSINLIAIW